MTAPIAYLTDVEGMWTRLASFALGNPLVRFDGDRLVVSDGAIFVFGGDAIDRGPDSRRVVATLLEAKRQAKSHTNDMLTKSLRMGELLMMSGTTFNSCAAMIHSEPDTPRRSRKI